MYNNFNPYQNGYYPFSSPQMTNAPFTRPIRTPNSKMPITPPTRTKAAPKMTFSRFLNGTQEVIATVSSAIPLYTQVRPLFSGAKGLTKSFKNALFKNKATNKEVISNPEIITPKKTIKKEDNFHTGDEYSEQNSPNRPFF